MTFPIVTIEGVNFPDYSNISDEQWPTILSAAIEEATTTRKNISENPLPPSFENTFEALEKRFNRLTSIVQAFSVPANADATPTMLALSETWMPKIEEMETSLFQDPVLFQRFQFAYENRQQWDETQVRLAEDVLKSFTKAGASLDEEQRGRLLNISVRLAELSVLVQDKLNAASRETISFTREELAGMDEEFLKEAELEGGLYGVRMLRTNVEAVLTNCSVRKTRQIVQAEFSNRNFEGEHDTHALIQETIKLRQEKARLLGHKTYADLVLSNYMAKNAQAVNDLVSDSWNKLQDVVNHDLDILKNIAAADGIEEMKAWDVMYYTEKVRQKDYSVDNAQVRAYLPLGEVQKAAFSTAEKLFGIRFEPVRAPVYHSDCEAWLVRNKETKEVVGGLITDYRNRDTKGSGAWMENLVLQHHMDEGQKPLVVNVCSFGTRPDLYNSRLDMLDASTLFHELGHALHSLLSQVKYPGQAGTNVVHDWVELPSQLLENWITSEQGLLAHARHVETGDTIPEDLAKQIIASNRFGQAFQKISYLQATQLDMAIHTLENGAPENLREFSNTTLQAMGADDILPPWHDLAHFSHLFAGGYAAGYYGYLWAEVMEADVFTLFENTDLFDQNTAHRVHQLVYASGDSKDAAALFEELVGRAPSPDALMNRLGAKTKPKHKLSH